MKTLSGIIFVAIALTVYSLTVTGIFEARGGPEVVRGYHQEYQNGGSCKWRFLPAERESDNGRYGVYRFIKTWSIWTYPASLLALVLALVIFVIRLPKKSKTVLASLGVINLAILFRSMWVGVLSAAMNLC